MNDWLEKGIENYEREKTLYKRNIELRNLTPEELDRADTRRQIESQAVAERAQAKSLSALTKSGAKLIEDAAANDQFSSNHLETLAEMMERLEDIHDKRMPSVSDLLKKAAQAAASSPGKQADKAEAGDPKEGSGQPQNGSNQNPGEDPPEADESSDSADSPKSVVDDPSLNSPKSKAGKKEESEESKVPSISMKESSMDVENPDEEEPEEPEESSSSPSKLKLPSVVLNDPNRKDAAACPAGQQMDEAVDAQEELLAEFEAVMDELQELISNLEGSTFVKRLKAMSRRELVMARSVNEATLKAFGSSVGELKPATVDRAKLLAKRQRAHKATLQIIEDDLEAYSNRVQQGKFKTVLAEMRDLSAVKQTGVVAERIVTNQPGTSIAQAEFLADTFDRWAEQLVGPG